MFYFNPRSREGSDYQKQTRYFPGKSDFNPRSREGSDMALSMISDSRE